MQEASDEQESAGLPFLRNMRGPANEVTFHADTFRDKLSWPSSFQFAGAAVKRLSCCRAILKLQRLEGRKSQYSCWKFLYRVEIYWDRDPSHPRSAAEGSA